MKILYAFLRSHYLRAGHTGLIIIIEAKKCKRFFSFAYNFHDALSCFDLHLAGEHEPQVILGIYRQVLNQATPEVFTEVRHLIGQAFQRRNEPLELPPADAALPDFGGKGVTLGCGRLEPADHLVVPEIVGNLVLRDPRVLGDKLLHGVMIEKLTTVLLPLDRVTTENVWNRKNVLPFYYHERFKRLCINVFSSLSVRDFCITGQSVKICGIGHSRAGTVMIITV